MILLDIMMPGIDGFTLCKKLRNQVDCPDCFPNCKIRRKQLGKWFVARRRRLYLQAFWRYGIAGKNFRPFAAVSNGNILSVSRLNIPVLIFLQSNFQSKDVVVPLTKGEYEICEFLARNQGQVFTKEQILENVFGYDSESNDSTIITHIKNIRNKLQEFDYAPIKTVWGVGYKWEE